MQPDWAVAAAAALHKQPVCKTLHKLATVSFACMLDSSTAFMPIVCWSVECGQPGFTLQHPMLC